jgi:hypothetical protein
MRKLCPVVCITACAISKLDWASASRIATHVSALSRGVVEDHETIAVSASAIT